MCNGCCIVDIVVVELLRSYCIVEVEGLVLVLFDGAEEVCREMFGFDCNFL